MELEEEEVSEEEKVPSDEEEVLSPEEYLEKSLVHGDLDSAGGYVTYDKDPPKPVLEEKSICMCRLCFYYRRRHKYPASKRLGKPPCFSGLN